MAVLVLGVAIAVFFLYRGTGQSSSGKSLPHDAESGLYQAVPSDAVAVLGFKEFETLANKYGTGIYASIEEARAILSFHYVGSLQPLLIVDVAKAGGTVSEDVFALRDAAKSKGLFTALYDCSKLAEKGGYLGKRQILLISPSDVLLQSSQRHIAQSVSVLDKAGFTDALAQVSGAKANLVFYNELSDKIINEVFTSKYRKYADFFKRFSQWTAFRFDEMSDESLLMKGMEISEDGHEKFSNVLNGLQTAPSSVAKVIPSYTIHCISIPLADCRDYIDAYAKFAEIGHGRSRYEGRLAAFKAANGIPAVELAENIAVREVALASFYASGTLEQVLLIRAGKLKNQPAGISYSGFASALFGPLFSVADESASTIVKDWIVIGSARAVEEYTSERALSKTLETYLGDAGLSGSLSVKDAHVVGYFSILEDGKVLDAVFRPRYADRMRKSCAEAVYAPVILTVSGEGRGLSLTLETFKVREVRTEAPEFERDTTVVVPKGPFGVKNSGTGRINEFYQNSNMYLCLRDENGKGLWGAEFHTPICGCASTVDYFANGKLQILFASGSKLYLIDRLGRFVSPFPVDLGKEILIGPAVYDFSGARRYNVLVLHRDNTVDMYNLHGKKPEQWKGIAPKETVKALPERIDVGGKTYWVVRTSIETLIYPFYGGEPLTVFEGGQKIRPDSAVTLVKDGMEVTRYDGRKTTVKL